MPKKDNTGSKQINTVAEAAGKINIVMKKAPDGSMQVRREAIPEMPDYLRQIIEEMK